MPRKIYHLHIKKSGGTSLNEWLNDSVSFARVMAPGLDGALFSWHKEHGISMGRAYGFVSNAVWNFFDVIHTHKDFLSGRIEGSRTISVFRDPVARSASLFFDDASLAEHDFLHKRPMEVAFHRDCLSLPFSRIREKWGKSAVFLCRYADPMCRALIEQQVSFRNFLRLGPKERFNRALASMDQNIDSFGLTEQMGKTVHHFSQILGLYPKTSLPELNIGRAHQTEFTEEDRRYLESITAADRMLYETLSGRFKNISVQYSVEGFERDRLTAAMERVETKKRAGRLLYDMNAALIGDGFWGRDSRGTPDVCRWTGPGNDSVIYIPSPSAPEVKIAIEVRGWLSAEARSSFNVKVWGQPAEHAFTPGENLADVVTFSGTPRAGVLKLELHAVAKTDDECGHPHSDGRRKGMLINRILVERAGQ